MDDLDQFDLNFDASEPKPPEQKRPSLLDPAKAKRVTEDAIERSQFLANDKRKAELKDAVWLTAKPMEIMRADYVWDLLGEVGDGDDNGSALGWIMRNAAKDGWIKKIGTEESQRPSMHKKRQGVWRSLIYDPMFRPPVGWNMDHRRKCKKCGYSEWTHRQIWSFEIGADHEFELGGKP